MLTTLDLTIRGLMDGRRIADARFTSDGRAAATQLASKEAHMPKYGDALRGYAHAIHQRDNFTCRYCGLDGKVSLSAWLSLSWDHLLPKSHAQRDNPEYIVTACNFCNTADNRYFDLALKRGITFDGLSPAELVAQRRPYVKATRDKYQEFWEAHVRGTHADETGEADLQQ